MPQSLAQLVDEITVDAYDVSEQMTAFLQVFEEAVAYPIDARVLDVAVEVTGIGMEGDDRRGLVARCRHEGAVGTVSLVDVRFEPSSIAAWLHAAYRTWLCLRPFPARPPRHGTWPGA